LTDDEENPEDLISQAIAGAEEVVDPLANLLEKAIADPSAPFDPEVLRHLASLKVVNLKEFESLRVKLKAKGCRVTAIDDAITNQHRYSPRHTAKQADVLIGLANDAELFHTPDRNAFADIDVDGHRETWPIKSKGFRRWLLHRYYENSEGAPGSEALQSALNTLEAKAHFDGLKRQVFVRVAGLEGKFYLDLADAQWRAVEVDKLGWRVIDTPPVRFRRSDGMLPLPVPLRGGSITTLRWFLNVKRDADFELAAFWILAALRPHGPYPVLALSGEQGSAKSTFTKLLKTLVDPSTAPIRTLPHDDRTLFIAATNAHLLAFDNISQLPPWLSDVICRLSTGGGLAARQLFTDQDEVLFTATRPVILNGIEEIVTRPDLADRSLLLTLEPISEERRCSEDELWGRFDAEHPSILGAFLDAVAHGLKNLPATKLQRLPRMADFALWGTACETAFCPAGTFSVAYAGNLDEAVEAVMEADSVAVAVRTMMTSKNEWIGTATKLLTTLASIAGEGLAKSPNWPKGAGVLSNRLRRAAPILRKVGIDITHDRDNTKKRNRRLRITATHSPEGNPEATSSRSSTMSNTTSSTVKGPPFDHAPVSDDVYRKTTSMDPPTVHRKPLKNAGGVGVDAEDDEITPNSGSGDTIGWRGRI
jgi:hypothetical protein